MVNKGEIVMIMGYPAIGKSRYAETYVKKGYLRLNRDTIGCSLDDLIGIMQKKYQTGETNFVLDNTYMTKDSRASVIKWAKTEDFTLKIIWITSPPKKQGGPEAIEIAQYNSVKRMIDKYGKLLTNEEIKKMKNPNIFPPAALFASRKKFQKPTKAEGFDSLKIVHFKREMDKSKYKGKAIILDYDGTLRITKSGEKYPKTPDDIKVLPNRSEVLKYYKSQGYLLLGVSNQSFIGKGTITENQAIACFDRTNELLDVDIEYRFCPHNAFPVSCYCRKPMPGLGVEFIEKYKLDPEQTIMVGDLTSDKTFARRCGINYQDAEVFFSKIIDSFKEDLKKALIKKGTKEDRIRYLEDQINYHQDLYYNNQPEISDTKFDLLEDELRKLDPNNSTLFSVGVDSSELFTKKEHIIPMMSQDKVIYPEDFIKWIKKRNISTFLTQYKLDGISIELQYKNGVFECAISRGNGKVGDDVSANVFKMKDFLPNLKSKFTGAIRGEVVMLHDVYNMKYSSMQNCRNAAAGIVRRKDGVGNNDLSIIFYDAISMSDKVLFDKESDKIKWLHNEGLNAVYSREMSSSQEVIEFRQEVMNIIRKSLEYDIDGLVIKDLEIDLEDMKRSKPRKQVAFKFEAEEIETTLKEVEWSMSGHLYTPVAIVETVQLMGSNVSRASLANPNLIKDLKLKIGSTVIVCKRGDIIPKIERVLITPENAADIQIPTTCETCKTELVNEGTRLYCPNKKCPKRAYHRIKKWIKILNVKYFGERLMLKDLFERGRVKQISDLYTLTKADISQYGGTAEKALDNLFAIEEVSLAKFIAGFNIENIGESLVQKVVDAEFDTFEKMCGATENDIINIEGFADITANTLVQGLKERKREMETLLSMEKIQISSVSAGIFKGLTFCITGKLNKVSRKEAENLILLNSGQVKSNVVKNLSYLVTNSTESTAKFEKAKAQGAKIISEELFLEMVKGKILVDEDLKEIPKEKEINKKTAPKKAPKKTPKKTSQVTLIEIPKKSDRLQGLSFCFTGSLSMTRNQAEQLVIAHGGTPKRSISRGLSYLVTNSETETAKFLKAQQLAVKIVNEAEFIDLIKVKQTNISDF